jgi:hypothetical protein
MTESDALAHRRELGRSRQLRHSASEAWRDKHRANVRTYAARHRDKIAARDAVKWALQTGALVRQSCWCGGVGQAHHGSGYAREAWLIVEWLCSRHHAEAHHGSPD